MAQRADDTASNALYRAFWRWHFYAGLAILPVLMLMALTGGLYLFKDEINGLIYRPLVTVEARGVATTPDDWAAAALAAAPGRIAQLAPPADPSRSARLVLEGADGVRREVFVDPHDSRVLGSIPDGGVMAIIKRLHSLDIVGPWANILVEIAAGWAIVMVATGFVLWWPRGQAGGVVSVRGAPSRRVFWRDLHAVTAAFAGLVIAFLAVTGMPWSAVWGKEVRSLINQAGWGRPAAPAGAASDHGDHAGHAAPADAGVPWALQDTTMSAHDHAGMAMGPISLEQAVLVLEDKGLPRPFALNIPAKEGQAWTASYSPEKVEAGRTLYMDPMTGTILADIGYGQFGPGAKAVEWGISVHQGRQFGLFNKLLMLAGCIAVWLLGISAGMMWWKRRPKRGLGAPPAPEDKRGYRALALVVAPLALLYPLVGASIVAVLAGDFTVRRVLRAARN